MSGTKKPVSRDGRCPGHTRSGEPCKQVAGYGTDHVGFGCCKFHGGSTRNGRKNGAKLRAQGEFGALLEECGLKVAGRSVVEALSDALDRAGAMVLAWATIIDELDENSAWSWDEHKGQRGALDRWVTVQTLGLIGPNSQGEQRVHVAVEQYGLWVDRYGRLAKMAADLGLEERKVRINEQVGSRIVAMLDGLVRDLGLDPADPKVRRTVASHLRLVSEQGVA